MLQVDEWKKTASDAKALAGDTANSIVENQKKIAELEHAVGINLVLTCFLI